jgi:hypothetical protein
MVYTKNQGSSCQDFLMRKLYGENELVETLLELGIPVLILITSWEQALDLKKQGCQVLGGLGLGRWTQQELENLLKTFPAGYPPRIPSRISW